MERVCHFKIVISHSRVYLKKIQTLNIHKIIISASALDCSNGMGGKGVMLVYIKKIIESSLLWAVKDLKNYLKGNLWALNSMVKESESIKLKTALYKFNVELGLDIKSDTAKENINKVTSYYWTGLNSEFQYFLNNINDPEINSKWASFINKTAKEALHTLKDSNPRRNKAVAKAIKELN